MKRWLRMTVLTGMIALLAVMLLSFSVFGADDVITVNNAAQLIKLFEDIDAETVSSACTVKLANDIDLAGKLPTLKKEFTGVFDGNGKTLSGITQPLFRQFNGRVVDLTLRGEIDATEDGFYDPRKAASFAQSAQDASAIGLVSGVNIKTKASDINGGGLFGYAKGKCSFLGCRYEGEYSVEWLGSNAGIGGIVGWCNPDGRVTTFENCSFGGKITVTGGVANKSAWVGGILGNESQAMVFLKNCVSEGTVTSAITDGTDYVGGILGINRSASNLIDRCINQSSITALVNAGGIVGGLIDEDFEISFCVNRSDVKAANIGGLCGVGERAVFSCSSSVDFSPTGKLCSTEHRSVNSYTSDLLRFEKTLTLNGAEYDKYNLCTIDKASGLPVVTLVTEDGFEAYVSTRDDGATEALRFLVVTDCKLKRSVTLSLRFLDWE